MIPLLVCRIKFLKMDFTIYFCNLGRENLREMKPDDSEVHPDEDGLRYVVKRGQLTKNKKMRFQQSCLLLLSYEAYSHRRCRQLAVVGLGVVRSTFSGGRRVGHT